MSAELASPAPATAIVLKPAARAMPRVIWAPIALVGLYWAAVLGMASVEAPFFYRFLFGMAAPTLLFLAFNVWWWTRRWVSLADRLLGFVLVVAAPIAMAWLTHRSIGVSTMLMTGLPLLLTALSAWLLAVRTMPLPRPRLATLTVALVTLGGFALVRFEGVDGDLRPSMHWRWSLTAEERFLASASRGKPSEVPQAEPADSQGPVQLTDGDWPAFRGPGGDGRVLGVAIDADWKAHPPRLVWKQRVGPAWSSILVIGERLYTQEQRGEEEAVVCYDAASGREIWAHLDKTRFWESVSGAGPRATPTFFEGKLYTVGATGLVNCLDAATGKPHWTVDLKTQADATIPSWGLSCSALVVGNLCIVYGGGEGHPNLLAYDAQTGSPIWTAKAGGSSYASPQLATLDGQPQVLMHHDYGLTSVDPATGKPLWQAGVAMPGAPCNLQVHVVGERQLLGSSLAGMGFGSIEASQAGDKWTITNGWSTSQIKPEFSDFVLHEGHAYGFDGAIFSCVDVATGKRIWKAGRYGRGQVVLLADQGVLLVISERGEAILVAASPDKHQELGRIQAISGKTWNHPAVAHGRLYLRNAEEMACYELESD